MYTLTRKFRWLSSPAVTLTMPEAVEVRIPGEIVRQRSTVLRKRLNNADRSDIDVLSDDTSVTHTIAFNALVAWIAAAAPRVQEQDGLDFIVQVAILADELGVWGFCNQAVDLLDRQIRHKEWTLTPTAVDAVYTRVAESRPLRKWVAARVDTIGPELERTWPTEQDKWEPVFRRHANLGWDMVMARFRGPPASCDPCRYHDHPWICANRSKIVPYSAMGQARRVMKGGRIVEPTCPYLRTDHYPAWTLGDEESAEGLEADGELVDHIVSD